MTATTNQQAVFAPMPTTAYLRITGNDRLDFLQGQLTNEVKRLQDGQFSIHLMLNHKGHALAQATVFKRSQDVLLAIEGNALPLVEAQLRRHIIFDQVVLEPLDATCFILWGEESSAVTRALDASPQDGQFSELSLETGTVIIHPSYLSPTAYLLHASSQQQMALLEALKSNGATAGNLNDLEVKRVFAGIPTAAGEAGEGILPQEAGLEFAVSYNKGCYLGQEIMARLEARGKLRRSLFGLKLDGIPQNNQREIVLNSKTVGQLGTVVTHPSLGIIALAVLRNDLAENAQLSVAGVAVRGQALPFTLTE